ncbi:hypothetical protein H310_13619 [Aphanomyces invadans]|uniref:SET domain-containing protein n=1 Tax=Aphanomyces invadans TaxID=157072 RepID=A0A024TDB6_9STRA|nr:hypothetical protein H310_13619 [Aphanomyces invadans]ETV91979.1 hypothetical protein H310_13619 [Aphanomyces invadans]|eukprot:XP_008879403.1 hypothetical protein H310_13619 [Aphanomyces invadans]
MEFDAPTFATSVLSHDLSKPIVATAALAPGQVIFAEVASIVSAGGYSDDESHEPDCDDDDCGGCCEVDNEHDGTQLDADDLAAVSPYVAEHYDALGATCDSLAALTSVDKRKTLFKLLHMAANDVSSPLITSLLALDVSANHHLSASMDAAKALRASHAGLIPSVLSDDQVAHVIAVLNKHSIPLEEVDAVGLFVVVPKLKHSCEPNAAYTDSGDAIYVTAIRPIAVGDAITVDFFDSFYMTVADRAQVFQEEGEPPCGCSVCNGTAPDKSRSFRCQVAGCDGIVHPTNAVFECTKCHATWTDATIAAAEAEEKALTSDLDNTENFGQLDAILKSSKLHLYHHIFYTVMQVLSEENVVDISDDVALSILTRQIDALNYVVPFAHSEKVSLYDSIAQAHIALGDIAKAADAYACALAVCHVVFGSDSKTTQLFATLASNTPKSVDEIPAAYGLEWIDDPHDFA